MTGGISISGHSPYCSEGSMALLSIVYIMFRYREHNCDTGSGILSEMCKNAAQMAVDSFVIFSEFAAGTSFLLADSSICLYNRSILRIKLLIKSKVIIKQWRQEEGNPTDC